MTKMRRISVAQMTSTAEVEQNLQKCERFAEDAKSQGADCLFLPECCVFIGEAPGAAQSLGVAQDLQGSHVERFRALAARLGLWISVGGFPETCPSDPSKLHNTHLLFNATGDLVSTYRKIHLFDVDIEGGPKLQESQHTEAGSDLSKPTLTPLGQLGLLVCYDMRFPEVSGALRSMGADLLAYPSAFTVPTGKAHWEPLLRARAIETQCFVVAAAQVVGRITSDLQRGLTPEHRGNTTRNARPTVIHWWSIRGGKSWAASTTTVKGY